MAYNKHRHLDEKKEQLLHSYLVENFYKNHCSKFTTICEKTEQIKGIDTIATLKDGSEHKIDEKSSVNWRNIKTFTLELSFKDKNDNLFTGWYLNDDLETTDYLFSWIDDSTNKPYTTYDLKDIGNKVSVQYALVPKEAIKKELDEIGWTKENLLKKDTQIREFYSEFEKSGEKVEENSSCPLRLPRDKWIEIAKKSGKTPLINGFTFSTKLPEKPINIQLNRERLIEMSIAHN